MARLFDDIHAAEQVFRGPNMIGDIVFASEPEVSVDATRCEQLDAAVERLLNAYDECKAYGVPYDLAMAIIDVRAASKVER
jgi:hypothetical protein